mgnify:CR=1 FL=1
MGIYYGSMAYTVSGRKKSSYKRKNTTKQVGKSIQRGRTSYVRSTKQYPSRPDTVGVTPRIENPTYTGSLVRGIATMHKSNGVPVINETEMRDIARMRR